MFKYISACVFLIVGFFSAPMQALDLEPKGLAQLFRLALPHLVTIKRRKGFVPLY